MNLLLNVKNLSFQYDNSEFQLEAINFNIKENTSIALAGVSGSGKSTLLKCIAGLLSPNQGAIEYQNEPVLSPHEQLIPGHPEIAYLSQDFSLDTHHTVKENIKNKVLHLPYQERDRRVEKLLKITELKALENLKPKELSGGQQQKLAFARAVANRPQLLLMDEAFNQLDIQNKMKLSHFIHHNREENQSIIWVSHEPREIFQWTEKVLVLHKGKLVRKTTPQKLYEQPRTAYEAALTGNYIPYKLFKKTIYLRPENIQISEKPTQQIGDLLKSYYIQGKFEHLISWKKQLIRIDSDSPLNSGKVYLKITPYACKTNY